MTYVPQTRMLLVLGWLGRNWEPGQSGLPEWEKSDLGDSVKQQRMQEVAGRSSGSFRGGRPHRWGLSRPWKEQSPPPSSLLGSGFFSSLLNLLPPPLNMCPAPTSQPATLPSLWASQSVHPGT